MSQMELPTFFANPGVVAFGMLLHAQARLIGAVAADLKSDSGFSISEFDILLRLATAPEGQLRPSELAASADLTTGGCTRLLDRLERDDVIRRDRHPTDRRGYVVVLTESGAQQLKAALPNHLQGLQRHFIDLFDADELQNLTTYMERIRSTFDPQPAYFLPESA